MEKYFDAKDMRNVIDDIEWLFSGYREHSDGLISCYEKYRDNELFQGELAEASKQFIDKRQITQAKAQVAMQQKLLDRNRTYELYLEKISLLSPASRLKGGYSFARTLLGRPLHSVSQLEPGRTFDLVFSDGHAEVEPVRIYRDSDKV